MDPLHGPYPAHASASASFFFSLNSPPGGGQVCGSSKVKVNGDG